MLTIKDLLFWFMASTTLVCLIILTVLVQNPRVKGWYVGFMASFLGWVGMQSLPNPKPFINLVFYLLPMIWIAVTLAVTLPPLANGPAIPPQTGEPHLTQEQLRGPSGTRQALNFYFALVVIALVTMMTFFQIAKNLP